MLDINYLTIKYYKLLQLLFGPLSALQEMIIAAVEVFSEHMRECLLSGGGSVAGGGALPVDVLRTRLLANLRHLREAYDSLLKLDLPSQV